MRTKLFKKLSFVLVAAMVLSLLVPAAGAFAASKPSLNSTNKYLHLGVEKKDTFNFNINNKGKGWQYYWESSDEDVVTVNEKNGVVKAVGVGKATITCYITDADDEEVATLEATVTVRDNIKELEIVPPKGVDAYKVGEEYDFNRNFKTVSGSTKKTSAITRWTVEPEGAEIDDKGVFVASKAGEYTITARAFQSKAKYNDWKADPVKYEEYVLTTAEYKVKVGVSIAELKQVDLDTVNLTFDSPVEDLNKDTITLSKVIGTAKVKEVIKSVEVSSDKTTASITLYYNFTPEAVYEVAYGDLSERFQAARTNVEDVAAIEITTSTVVLNTATAVGYKLYNAAGVDITAAIPSGRVTMTASGGLGVFFNASTKELTIYTKDASTTITAVFHTWKYDPATGKETVLETAKTIVGVEAPSTNITGLSAWTVGKSADWDNVRHSLPLESGYSLFVKLAKVTGSDTGEIKPGDAEYESKVTFQSADTNYLIVNTTNGALYPLKEGKVSVIVYYDGTAVGGVEVQITAARAASEVTLSKYNVTLSNNTSLNATETIEVKAKDQYGEDYTSIGTITVTRLNPDPELDTDPITTGTSTSSSINVSGASKKPGTYYYKITVLNTDFVVTVTIQDGTKDTTVKTYGIELSSSEIDLKFDPTKASDTSKTVTIDLYGYNAAGVKVKKLTATGDYKLTFNAPEGWDASANFDTDTSVLTLASATSGVAITKAPVGSYKVTLEVKLNGNFVPVQDVYFTVKDTQPAPYVSEVVSPTFTTANVDISTKDNPGLLAAVNACLKFKLGDNPVLATDVVEVDAFGTNDQFNVRSVTIRQTFASGAHIDHKVNVGYTLTKTK